jgi:hypothetical protein
MAVIICLVVWVFGFILFMTCKETDPRLKEISKIMFWVGLLAFLLRFDPSAFPHLHIGN